MRKILNDSNSLAALLEVLSVAKFLLSDQIHVMNNEEKCYESCVVMVKGHSKVSFM